MATNEIVPLISELVDKYFAMWNETDERRRREVIETAWAHDASYVDPLFAVEGHDALNAMVVAVHEQYPGHRFTLRGAVDAHHDRAHWSWELTGPNGGEPIAAGIDFAVRAPDGRLREVAGFFKQPAA